MKKKKVLYIISDIDKALAFEWIATNIDVDKIDLSFVLLNSENAHLKIFLEERNIQVLNIKGSGKKDWPLILVKLIGYLNAYKPDIVHCHLLTASILGLTAAKIAGIKTRIYTRHHSDFHFRYFPKGVKWDKWCNRLATQIIVPSGTVQKVLIKREGVVPSKIKLIHHGFDLDYFKNVSADTQNILLKKYNPDKRYPVIGVISRFTQLKGIQYIIPAFKQLQERYPGALLLLFNAKGDYEPEINELLDGLPPRSYKTIPFEKELAAVYSLFDVFVQVSVDTDIEAFGQTYVEALAAGIPSVFTLAGIANDFIIDNYNAVVVPFKNTNKIFEGILKIVEDKTFSDKLKINGIVSVKTHFTLSEMINQLMIIYLD